jgi:hypothetical protein
MVGRLGTVLYWIGCIIAFLTGGFALYVYAIEGHSRSDGYAVTGGILVVAFVIWLIGYALRYILSGPKAAPANAPGKS